MLSFGFAYDSVYIPAHISTDVEAYYVHEVFRCFLGSNAMDWLQLNGEPTQIECFQNSKIGLVRAKHICVSKPVGRNYTLVMQGRH